MKDLQETICNTPPRAIGALEMRAVGRDEVSKLQSLFQSGCLKALFPRRENNMEAVIINIAGGITGGDRLRIEAHAMTNAHLTLTTQACERIYRAQPGSVGRLDTQLTASDSSTLNWIPQETILYNHGQLERSLTVDLAQHARALIVEPVLFGRLAMGETQLDGLFCDQVLLRIEGKLVYRDATMLRGDITAQLARPAVAAGMCAMATIVYRAPDAAGHLPAVRSLLNQTSGCSLLANDFCVLRLLAVDGFALRTMMLPILDLFTQNALPKCWRL